MNDRTFCSEMQELKELLTALVVANGGSVNSTTGPTAAAVRDEIPYQFPESTADLLIAAGATYERSKTVKRRLKSICVSIPQNCVLEFIVNNTTILWFSNESGCIDLSMYVEELTFRVKNLETTGDSKQWSCRLVFAA